MIIRRRDTRARIAINYFAKRGGKPQLFPSQGVVYDFRPPRTCPCSAFTYWRSWRPSSTGSSASLGSPARYKASPPRHSESKCVVGQRLPMALPVGSTSDRLSQRPIQISSRYRGQTRFGANSFAIESNPLLRLQRRIVRARTWPDDRCATHHLM